MRVVLYVTPVFLSFMVMISYLMLVKVRHCFKLFTAVLETTRSLLLNLSYSLLLRHFKINYNFLTIKFESIVCRDCDLL
jgi:hypothetical protein